MSNIDDEIGQGAALLTNLPEPEKATFWEKIGASAAWGRERQIMETEYFGMIDQLEKQGEQEEVDLIKLSEKGIDQLLEKAEFYRDEMPSGTATVDALFWMDDASEGSMIAVWICGHAFRLVEAVMGGVFDSWLDDGDLDREMIADWMIFSQLNRARLKEMLAGDAEAIYH